MAAPSPVYRELGAPEDEAAIEAASPSHDMAVSACTTFGLAGVAFAQQSGHCTLAVNHERASKVSTLIDQGTVRAYSEA